MTEASARRHPSNPWVVLGTLLLISILNFADRYLITGLVGPIKTAFGLGDGTMGLLMGPAFVCLYVLLGVPFARLADRSSRVRIIAVGCFLWSAATVATGLATGPVGLLLARIGVGVGEAAFVAPAYSLLADYFRPERRGFAFAILGLATYIGQIAGQGGGPVIAAAYDWRTAFYLIGGIGVALAFVCPLLVREPGRAAAGAAPDPAAIAFVVLVRLLLRSPGYLLMMAAFSLGALSGVAFAYWAPELFTRSHSIDPVAVKGAFALYFGLSGMGGTLAFGLLADRLSRRNMAWPVRLSAIAIACATTAILLSTWATSFTAANLYAIPAGLLGGGWSVGFLATLQYMLPPRFRAGATALFLAVVTLTGYFIAPWATGAISQSLGDDAPSLRWALTAVIPLGFVAAGLAWLASGRIERDRLAFDAAIRAA